MSESSFANFGSGGGAPVPVGTLLRNRLIPQDGIRRSRDPEWQTDTWVLPFKVYRPDLPGVVFPARFAVHPQNGNMFFSHYDVGHGKVMADVTLTYVGCADGNLPNHTVIKPVDTISLNACQVSVSSSDAAADVAFYAPQTVWKWVAKKDDQYVKLGIPRPEYCNINNPSQIVIYSPGTTPYYKINGELTGRRCVIVRYQIRRATDRNAEGKFIDTPPADLTPDEVSQVTGYTAEPFGDLFKCTSTVIRTLKSPSQV